MPTNGAINASGDRRVRVPAEPIRRAFVHYALATLAAAVVVMTLVLPRVEWRSVDHRGSFWLFAAFLFFGELLPIQVPRRHSHDKVSISTAFAFAVLLAFGVGPAVLAYVVASVINDAWSRSPFIKAVFNASQYALSVSAAAATLQLLGHGAPVPVVADALPAIVVAGVVWFCVNHLLAGTGAALLTGSPVSSYLLHDLPFQIWTAGFLLILAPIVVVSADESLVLVPISFLPMLGIYFGGRQAAMNAHRALHDALTDLPNRTLLRERLDAALEQASRERLSAMVLMIDLDDFKAVNDSLGHHFGDQLLVQVAERLTSGLREGDTLARLGGDEFAIVAEAVSETAESKEIAQRILNALEDPFELDSLSLDVRASIGIACYPQHGGDADELLQHADMALYRAKDSELPYELFGPDQDSGIDRLALATQLRQGIERGELVLHYQPKFPLRGGRPEGVEALVRWNHPQLGTIGPDGFIPLAEQTGLIKPLTDYVLSAALSQCAEWRRAGLALRMSVNLCTRSLLDQELAFGIRAHLGEYGLPPSALQLEITESRMVTDLRRARRVLDELRAMGVAIAIDDFGTGFSSLTQLQQLPVDEIKIDKSFVINWESSKHDQAIVRSTIGLGRNLGIHVTAEGVESESVYQELSDLGCDYAQGFFLARPTGARQCAREIERRADDSNGRAGRAAVAPLGGAVTALVPSTDAALGGAGS